MSGQQCRVPSPSRMHVVFTRRRTLGLFAAASVLPSRSLANVAWPRTELRADLAKHFTDVGTSGTFVAYDVDAYILIVSDHDRSADAKLPASTYKVPNSVIALETGVVGD